MEPLIRLCGSEWYSYARELAHQLVSHATKQEVIRAERME